MLHLSLLLTAAFAGVLDQPWRTVETEHFRLHYPAEAEAWALESAAQLEDIRARVSEEVGYAPDQVVDLVVMDPYTQANGFALPWINGPRMGVFASPPNADSILGNYRSWEEDLIVHEDAHLVHMMIPSRNPWVHFFVDRGLGAGPVTVKSGRWVFEGYATVVEGRLTGAGRPNGDGRALLLRQMAREGRMPAYWELDASEAWRGGSYAYLVGSAYLEWLELRQGEGSLRDLWSALSAHTQRDFDVAFEAVFGDWPDVLYARFVAELTRDALAIEAARPIQEGTIWQDLWGSTGAPTVSPDGERLAVVVRPEEGPSRLVVWGTGDNDEALEEWQEAVDEALAKDPEDVTPVMPEVLPREPEYERVRPDRGASEPRWTPDGRLLFATWMRAGDGRYVPDLVLWDPEGGERRVTKEASLHSADPHPDGARAIAVRQAWSASQLVWVDLESGEWTPITEPDINAVLDQPRISPDGATLAYLRNRDSWALVLRDLTSGEEREVDLPEGALIAQPAWAPDGSGLYASLGIGGFIEAWFLPVIGDGAPRQLTATRGGVAAPEPTPDGESLYFLSLDVEGRDLHKVSLAEPPPETTPFVVSPPVLRPPAPPPIDPPARAEVDAKPYRLGGLGVSPQVGAATSRGLGWVELGLRLGDVAGRTTLHLTGGFDGRNDQGLGGALAFRGLPVTVTLRGFTLSEERFNYDYNEPLSVLRSRMGAELDLDRTFTWASGDLSLLAGGWADQPRGGYLQPDAAVAGFGRAALDQTFWFSQVWAGFEAHAGGQYRALSEEGALLRAGGTLKGGFSPIGVEARYALDTSSGGYLSVGGLSRSLYAPGWTLDRLLVPGLGQGILVGDSHQSGGIALTAFETVELLAQRDYMTYSGGLTPDESDTVSHIALQVDTALPAQAIAKISGLNVQTGLACVAEAPYEGWRERACRQLDHYNLWLGVTWRP